MDFSTVLLIILAAITALTVVFYQYFYKNSRKGSLKIVLAALRFITLFCALLLLINPKFINRDYFLEKANLIVLVDDSSSMEDAQAETSISQLVNQLTTNEDLSERFSMHQYAFGTNLQATDSLHFNQRNTDISNALSTTDEIFVNGTNAVILISDGNQTLGRDYEYINLGANLSVNPVVVGDTTAYEDISVGLVNINTYAFLRNQFPVETTILYRGSRPVSKTVSISLDGTRVHQQRLNFDASKNSQTLNTLIEAKSVGVKTLKIEIEGLDNEKNRANNSKETAIEVIDEKTNVTIVSDILHPDIGALKKSIESNEQRSVSVIKPNTSANSLEDADILILYQPTRNFRGVYDYVANSGKSIFTITGSKTDWNFLNRTQQSFVKENINQSEDILPILNNAFGTFGLGNFNVDNFPPLKGNLGNIDLLKNGETLLYQQIKGVELDQPLFAIITEGKQREAALFGENMWRWRAQTYRNTESFSNFDELMGNLMVYLGSSDQRSRLELDFELVYDNASMALIRATYFDESYQFDSGSTISIAIQSNNSSFNRESPMLLKGNFYEVDLSDLEAGEYQFTVTVEGDNLKRSGSFKILDFNPEKQLISSNYSKLQRLADKTNGEMYYPNQMDSLISNLSTSQRYLPVQKSRQNVVSLIDFRILLGLIVLTLAAEWFIRKYNGLI
ncbi:VWA domain-containing protein [Muricauda sp. CAU 1633]|uniref:VWA domain-containing protein n=1 Tax=Allomuricauda sp. CAU 1633 TaxID=2816036 RepID=UPI001A8F17D9|nr:VWA domain-containing protein [Muricauda sp. CAU 1633]MBO0323285.1 VWA domain-containing protein [Muricauda sp. CAU 1633]